MLDTLELERIHDFPLTGESVAWIVGAFGGKTAQHYAERYDCWLELFEPQESFARTLREMFKDNVKVIVHDFGLRGHTGTGRMAVEGTDAASFIHPAGYQGVLSAPYRFVDVAMVLNGPVDLMFLNCEGGEFEIIPRLIEKDLMGQIKYLMVQFHPFVLGTETGDFEELRKKIDQTHTRIVDKSHTWTSWRRNG